MKKIICIACLAFSVFVVSPGCTGSQNSTAGTVTNGVIAILAGILQQIGGSAAATGVTAQTQVNSVLTTVDQVNSFKTLLSSTFQIPKSTVEGAYSGFSTLQNVANFVVNNAQQSTLPKS
jgi:hypothetical protein